MRRGCDGKAELVILDHGLYERLETRYFIPSSINSTVNDLTYTYVFYFRDRLNLCNLWKSIVLNNQDGIKHYARKLGVQGKEINKSC